MLALLFSVIMASSTPVLNPALIPICTCESGQGTGQPQQFNIKTGNVLHGKQNHKDIGMCQINDYWNGATALKHGWDIYTEEGNINMANYLYSLHGNRDWAWSTSCWKPQSAVSD